MIGWFPENVSTYGGSIDSLFSLIFYITSGAFILTQGTLLYFLIRYRRRDGRKAAYIHGDRPREAAWTMVPLLIVLALDVWIDYRGAETWAMVKGRAPASEIQVRITSKQFNWEVLYPGPDGRFGTADDLQLENELHVPVNKVVQVGLRSKDVIHSFFLPNLRLKQDCLPGREIQAWFEATKPGRYELPCAELCGFGHSGMRGWLTVHPDTEYTRWVSEHWPS
jgi:cytochrome c oxidase subunit 2